MAVVGENNRQRIGKTTAETSDDQGCKARVKGCLLRVWDSLPMKILFLVLFPLGLYLSDVITDLWLAVQYYYSGDSTWFGLTLGFVLGPAIIINLFSLSMAMKKGDNKMIICLKCLFGVLQLGLIPAYLTFLHLLVTGKDMTELEDDFLFFVTHLLETMLESVPQLCLQLYIIILTGEQVSDLKVISMVISLVAAAKALAATWYYKIEEEKRTFRGKLLKRFILIILWKTVEISTRVLAVGLFASVFQQWIALPIGVHLLIMTVSYIYVDDDGINCTNIVGAFLFMAVDTFSVAISMGHKRTFWPNTVLTLLGNITMVTMWYTQKTGQDWYDVPALMGVVVGSVVSAVCGFIAMVMAWKIESPVTFCCEKPLDQQELTVTVRELDTM